MVRAQLATGGGGGGEQPPGARDWRLRYVVVAAGDWAGMAGVGGVTELSAMLVRPDGHIARLWEGDCGGGGSSSEVWLTAELEAAAAEVYGWGAPPRADC